MLVKSPSSNTKVQNNRRSAKHPFDAIKIGRISSASKQSTTSPKVPRTSKPKITIAPGKLILWTVILGICGFLYITHVFTTQQTLQEVNQIRLEYERVRIIYEDRALTYNRMTGPAEIYARAKEQGFVDRDPSDQVIEVRR